MRASSSGAVGRRTARPGARGGVLLRGVRLVCAQQADTRDRGASNSPDARQTRISAAPVGRHPSATGRESGWGAASRRAQVIDPSFFIRRALPVALADTIVPDFPLANKSFNQSYAGNDL